MEKFGWMALVGEAMTMTYTSAVSLLWLVNPVIGHKKHSVNLTLLPCVCRYACVTSENQALFAAVFSHFRLCHFLYFFWLLLYLLLLIVKRITHGLKWKKHYTTVYQIKSH